MTNKVVDRPKNGILWLHEGVSDRSGSLGAGLVVIAVEFDTVACYSKQRAGACVESRSGAPREGLGPSVAAPFGGGASSGLNQRTFPDPARQTGHAGFPHPASVPKDSRVRSREVGRLLDKPE